MTEWWLSITNISYIPFFQKVESKICLVLALILIYFLIVKPISKLFDWIWKE